MLLRNLRQIFCRMTLYWNLSGVFLMVKIGVMGFGKENHRYKMPLSSHHIQGAYCQNDLSLFIVADLDHVENFHKLFGYLVVFFFFLSDYISIVKLKKKNPCQIISSILKVILAFMRFRAWLS